MKTLRLALLACALCLAACEGNHQPAAEPDHQPKYPGRFKLAGKVYVGDSKMIPVLANGCYEVFMFTEDSIFYYQTSNADLSPMGDYYTKTDYVLKYPDIEANEYPYPHVFTMLDTLTIKTAEGKCVLR